MKDVIAIFDVGRTNKKLILFDEQYRIVSETSVQLPESTDEEGFTCECVNSLREFIANSLLTTLQKREFNIKAVNFSAYGASFVNLDDEGLEIPPLYNYLKPYPEDLLRQFYENYGGEDAFSLYTAAPVRGNLNSGLQLYRHKYQRPGLFKSINTALHLPQYLSYIVTGRACSDITSVGCHTGLWNFHTNDYHEWVRKEGVIDKLAPFTDPTEMIRVNYSGHEINVGTGLHDSSAALIPYLVKFKDPFVLISTGTWCVSLNPFNDSAITTDEIQNGALCYLRHNGSSVKASTLHAGPLHDERVNRLAERFNVQAAAFNAISFDPALLSGSDTREGAYHQLIAEIVAQQVQSTRLVIQDQTKQIFVDGGFSKNDIYMNLLAAAFPERDVMAAAVGQASALGAALVVHSKWNNTRVPDEIVELRPYVCNPL